MNFIFSCRQCRCKERGAHMCRLRCAAHLKHEAMACVAARTVVSQLPEEDLHRIRVSAAVACLCDGRVSKLFQSFPRMDHFVQQGLLHFDGRPELQARSVSSWLSWASGESDLAVPSAGAQRA